MVVTRGFSSFFSAPRRGGENYFSSFLRKILRHEDAKAHLNAMKAK